MPRHLVTAVMEWFGDAARDLPWRDPDCSPWGVLVSEVMLQQTPVVRVEPAWRAWMERWPEPADLAVADQPEVLRAWGRLGYPRRALRLQECARALTDRHGGAVPSATEELLALPGVGEYTAAAVRAFAFGERDVVLDTNVRRVIGRAWNGTAYPRAHLTRAERSFAAGLVPEDRDEAATWNAAVMELGALVCTSRAPQCAQCPLESDCTWVAIGRPGLGEGAGRSQAWHGTDRQVRGRVLAILREAVDPVALETHPALADVDPGQLDRCVTSLVEDGLIRPASGAAYSL
ncbi:A/G-specific adenine glycosylase [uncultured Demequina sp.]|uniref:A/G-specific adenine glycosylase n=1 Tax=uncultured Demequina sp. TaxID=693499 RepID=UPI0025D59257|nr:A/G-specific adenine glycosylase [uncultured Demequina sp.]